MTRQKQAAGVPRNVYHHEKDFDNGLYYCAHRNRDNCRHCEYSSDPALFDGYCTTQDGEKGQEAGR